MKKLFQHTLVRYVIGGGTSACVNLAVLYIFHEILGIYYLTASVFAFAIAFFVSLFFHRFWTFRDHVHGKIHEQGALYLLTSLFGLGMNTLILFILVSYVYIPVLIGQVVAGGLVAGCTFYISKHFVFRSKAIQE